MKRNNSVIVDLFYGMQKSTTVCSQCKNVCKKFDAFHSLSLPVPGVKQYDEDERQPFTL